MINFTECALTLAREVEVAAGKVRKCRHCGAEVTRLVKRCPTCGQPLSLRGAGNTLVAKFI